MRTLGVDVSHWEGSIDWKLAAPGIGFAFYKCTDGTRWIDQQFYANRLGCQEAGLAHAPYHFYQPRLDPVSQAEFFMQTAGNGYERYIVDVETAEHEEQITQKLLAFLERAEQLSGIKPAIYTSAGYWNEFILPRAEWAGQYELIVAHYTLAHTPSLPVGWSSWRIWQFSNDWSFRGCNERADGDWFNGSYEECQAWFGNAGEADYQPREGGMRLRALFDNLHIRQSPSIKARVVGRLERGEVVEAEEVSGNEAWVRHGRGWTAIERGGYRYMEVVK